MNSVNLIGRLTRDPELKYTPSQQALCTFSLAVNKNLSREKKEELESEGRPTADFPRIIAWGKQAENISTYLSKGSQCAVIGRIQTGSYQDNETGKTIYTTDIIADRVMFLDGQNQSQNNAGATKTKKTSNHTSRSQNYNTRQNNDDFFGDDFEEVQDDGRIPF